MTDEYPDSAECEQSVTISVETPTIPIVKMVVSAEVSLYGVRAILDQPQKPRQFPASSPIPSAFVRARFRSIPSRRVGFVFMNSAHCFGPRISSRLVKL